MRIATKTRGTIKTLQLICPCAVSYVFLLNTSESCLQSLGLHLTTAKQRLTAD